MSLESIELSGDTEKGSFDKSARQNATFERIIELWIRHKSDKSPAQTQWGKGQLSISLEMAKIRQEKMGGLELAARVCECVCERENRSLKHNMYFYLYCMQLYTLISQEANYSTFLGS